MLVTLDRRIAALTGLDIQPPYAEYLQVVNYGIGGHYEPHFDHATVMMGSMASLLGGRESVCSSSKAEIWRGSQKILRKSLAQRLWFPEYLKALVSPDYCIHCLPPPSSPEFRGKRIQPVIKFYLLLSLGAFS